MVDIPDPRLRELFASGRPRLRGESRRSLSPNAGPNGADACRPASQPPNTTFSTTFAVFRPTRGSFQSVSVWNRSAEVIFEHSAHSYDMARLRRIEIHGFDVFLQSILAELEHLRRRRHAFEQRPGRAVHALIRHLRGKNHRDQKRIRVRALQFCFRRRIPGGEELKDPLYLVRIESMKLAVVVLRDRGGYHGDRGSFLHSRIIQPPKPLRQPNRLLLRNGAT